MNKGINIIFPHQLFLDSPLLDNGYDIYLIEEYLFFNQFKFHKQKIAFHRATMKAYQSKLESNRHTVYYLDATDQRADIREFGKVLVEKKVERICLIDPTDDWLDQRIRTMAADYQIEVYENPLFLNTRSDLSSFFRSDKKSFFQTTFYKQQRKRRGILIDNEQQPVGGKWTFDVDNRKKYPKGKVPPAIHFPKRLEIWEAAVNYTNQHFGENPGQLSIDRVYPITHKESATWFEQFMTYRFHDFGAYEDAIVKEHTILNHSLLSPLMNVGLILPGDIVDQSLAYAAEESIPINSTEGFIRQIIGWREFIRGMYDCKGRYSRSINYWNFDRKIPASFYDGTTGIVPVDDAIKKVLETGYCHHIERLMVLGNFMLLCEFDPDDVYRWFMELFIDAYDWVMVPNVYGMSQFADGGTFATKPYIGGANYIKKMSNYPKGNWEDKWNGLYWRFIDRQRDFFLSNPRMSMMVRLFDKMPEDKQRSHLENAQNFIDSL